MERRELIVLLPNETVQKAHMMVYNKVKSGDLKKQPCSVCGDINSIAHHEDYNKPIDVVWLCRKCHKARHRVLNQILNDVPKESYFPKRMAGKIIKDPERFSRALHSLQVGQMKEVKKKIMDITEWGPITFRATLYGRREMTKVEVTVFKIIYKAYNIEF